jgi:hypothetical protein
LVSDAVVSNLIMNKDEARADGIHYIERTGGAHREVYAKLVVVAASALESTRILLNSQRAAFPKAWVIRKASWDTI